MHRSALLLLVILAVASAQTTITYTVVNGTATGILSTVKSCNAGQPIQAPAAATTGSAALFKRVDITSSELTSSALTSSALTSSALTSSALTSAVLTTSPLSTAALTTSPLSTAALTTSPLSTAALTTSPLSTAALTSAALTTQSLSTAALTSASVTSTELTSSALSSSALSTASVTSGEVTSASLTSEELTTGHVTSNEFTTSVLSTSQLTSGAVSSSAVTSAAATSAAVTSGASTTTAGAACVPRLILTPVVVGGQQYLNVFFNVPLPQGTVTAAAISITYGGISPQPLGFFAVISYNNANFSSIPLLGNSTGDYSKFITQNNTVSFPGGLRINNTSSFIRVSVLYVNQNTAATLERVGAIYVDNVQASFTFTPLNNTGTTGNGTTTVRATTGNPDSSASQLASFGIAMLIASILALLF